MQWWAMLLFPDMLESPTVTNQLISGQMNQAQTILSQQHSTVGVFFPVRFGWSLELPRKAGEKLLWISNDGKDHWVLANATGEPRHVLTYDSLNKDNLHNDKVLSCISCLFQTPDYQLLTVFFKCKCYSDLIFGVHHQDSIFSTLKYKTEQAQPWRRKF